MDERPPSGREGVHARNKSSQSTNPVSPLSTSHDHHLLTASNFRQPYIHSTGIEGALDAGLSNQGRAGTLTVDLGPGLACSDELSPTSCRAHASAAGRSAPASGRNRWWPESAVASGHPSLAADRDSADHDAGLMSPDELHGPLSLSVGSSAYGGDAAQLASAMPSVGLSAGGYASSAEGDLYSNAASLLTSRTSTPLIGVNLNDRGGNRMDDATESEISEYDEQARLKLARGSETPRAATGMLGALGKGLAGEGFWASTTSSSASGSSQHVGTGARSRGAKKGKWVKPRGSERGWLLNPNLPGSSKHRRRPNAALTHPMRMAASFLGKLFRTFFGPIHPITILVALVLIASFVASVTKLIIYILNPDKEPLPWRTYCQQQPPFPHAYADALAPVDVFVGVFSIDSSYERRHLIRSTYAAHTVPLDPLTGLPTSNVQVRFIIGRPRKAHARRVALEMETYNDLVILDMEENMNRGKTHAYFKWAAENATVPFLRPVDPLKQAVKLDSGSFGQTREVVRGHGDHQERFEVAWKKADYVVKADDDAYIILEELERHLRVAPRQMTYWGYLIRNWFMGGECYALSSDLVQYVATSENVLHYTRGKEDKKVAQWINLHPNRADINWVSEHCWIYDHPKAGTAYSHGFLFPDHVEKIKLEGRRGLSDEETARRGGEHRAKSFSTVSRWHQAYTEPRGDLTIEEEVEALVEGGGRWAGTWVRGEEGNDTQVWVPREQLVYEANDPRLKPPLALNLAVHAALADEVQFDPETGLAIRRTGESRLARQERRGPSAAAEIIEPRAGLEARDGGLIQKLPGIPHLGDLPSLYGSDLREQKRAHAIRSAQPRLIPLPSHKDGNGEAEALRAKRYLGRRYGGTVVVHFLKKSEWFYETALAFSGRSKFWADGAGGSGTEWRMFGSPLVRHEDSYVSDGRSQPRPDVEMAYLQQARIQAQANAAQAQGQAARVGSFTKPRSPSKPLPQQPQQRRPKGADPDALAASGGGDISR
ncbi:hypothetical protein ACQY0O_000283 [Thecaphora frezii]